MAHEKNRHRPAGTRPNARSAGRAITTWVLACVLSFMGVPATAFAAGGDGAALTASEAPAFDEPNVIVSGTWGTCTWLLRDDMTLELQSGTGTDTAGESPWADIAGKMNRVDITGTVKLPVDVRSLFANMSEVTAIEGMGNLDWSGGVLFTDDMFAGCSSLAVIDLSGIDIDEKSDEETPVASGQDAQSEPRPTIAPYRNSTSKGMFDGCTSLDALVMGPGWREVRNAPENVGSYDDGSLKTAGFPVIMADEAGVVYKKNTGVPFGAGAYVRYEADYEQDAMHSGTWGTCDWHITSDGVLHIDEGAGAAQEAGATSPWIGFASDIKRIRFEGNVTLTGSFERLFAGLTSLEAIDGKADGFANVKTTTFWGSTGMQWSTVTSAAGMFEGCTALESVDMSGLPLPGCHDLSSMFEGCTALRTADLSALVTARSAYDEGANGIPGQPLRDMRNLFEGCTALNWLVTGEQWGQPTGGFSEGEGANVDWCATFPGAARAEDGTTYAPGERVPDGAATYWFIWPTGPCPDPVEPIEPVGPPIDPVDPDDPVEPEPDDPKPDDPKPTPDDPVEPIVPDDPVEPVSSGMWGTCPWRIDSDGFYGVLSIGEGKGAEQEDGADSPWAEHADDISVIRFEGAVRLPDNCSRLFAGLTALQAVDGPADGFENLSTSLDEWASSDDRAGFCPIMRAQGMFEGCTALLYANLEGLTLRNCYDLSRMFAGCSALVYADLGSLWTADSPHADGISMVGGHLRDMRGMFDSCTSLELLVVGERWGQPTSAFGTDDDWCATFPTDAASEDGAEYEAGERIPDGAGVYFRRGKDAEEPGEDGDHVVWVEPAEHGIIFASRNSASIGDEVSAIAIPDERYAVESISVVAEEPLGAFLKMTGPLPGSDEEALPVECTFTMPRSDVTVKATFRMLEGKKAIVALDADGGELADDPFVEIEVGASLRLSDFGAHREGYEIAGWRDDGGEVHEIGSEITVDGDMVLTAVWNLIRPVGPTVDPVDGNTTVTVTFEAGFDALLPWMNRVGVPRGTAITLASMGLSREGYELSGWRDANGEVHALGTEIAVNDDMMLTAVWDEIVAAPIPSDEPAVEQKDSDEPRSDRESALEQVADRIKPKTVSYAQLQLRSTKQTDASVKLKWKKHSGASKYAVFGTESAKGGFAMLATTGASGYTVKGIDGQRLRSGTIYKFTVIALDESGDIVALSKGITVATTGGAFTNAKGVKLAAKSGKISLRTGTAFKLQGRVVKANPKLKLKQKRSVSYESTNSRVASVTSAGVVKAKAPGTCYVYAYSQAGTCKRVKVKVARAS